MNTNLKYFLALVIIFSSCSQKSQSDLENYRNFDNASLIDEKLIILDSVEVDESSVSFGSIFSSINSRNYESAFSTIDDGRVVSYHPDGKLNFSFDVKATQEGMSGFIPIAYDINSDVNSIYILFAGKATIYEYSLSDFTLINETDIELEPDTDFLKFPMLKRVDGLDCFIIGTGVSNYTSESDFFQRSRLFSLFGSEGKFIRSLGQFPQYYQELAEFNTWLALFHSYAGEAKVSMLFGNRPEIFVFNLKDGEVDTVGQLSKQMDYEIKTKQNRQPTTWLNDTYYGFGVDEINDIYYYVLRTIPEGYGVNGNIMKPVDYLLKYDHSKHVYSELKKPVHYTLLEKVNNDTLTFYSESLVSEKKYLVYGIIK